MKPLRLLASILIAATLWSATGCYNRLTMNYSKIKELSSNGELIEETIVNDTKYDAKLRNMLLRYQKAEQAYTINAGDSIAITVYNHPDLSLPKTLVTPDGHIGMVLIGHLKVEGLTLEQAALKLEQLLSKYIRNPKVGISPLEIHSESATIIGAVKKPGMYTISSGMRLTDLFALAGGIATRRYDGQDLDAADFKRTVFVRNGEIFPIDFARAIETGDPLHNLLIRKGDYVYVAAKDDSMIFILGDVKNPQRRTYTQGLGMLELIASCGGVNETHWSHAIIIRGGISRPKLYKVDLDGILRGSKPNIMLEAGDIVYVPHDDISEYNVFIRKLFPTFQLINMISTPMFWYSKF